MEELLPILLLLFSGQKDKTPQFTEQCKAVFGSAIFENMSLGKWKAKEIADMIERLCKIFKIKMPKGLDFNTVLNLSNLASTLKMGAGSNQTKKDVSNTNCTETSLKNPLAPIIQIANADIIYILTNYLSA